MTLRDFLDSNNFSNYLKKYHIMPMASSIWSSNVKDIENFPSIILPRKTVFLLSTLLSELEDNIKIQTSENKIKLSIGKINLISKVIDGKFPDYQKVVPKENTQT